MSCAKHYHPLNPDLQALLDCSGQSRTVSRAVLVTVPCEECTQRGLPSSLCHDQLLAQRTAKQWTAFEVWDFSLEQCVLKQ